MISTVDLKALPIKRGNRSSGHQIVGVSDYEASIIYLQKNDFGEDRWHVKKNPTRRLIKDLAGCRALFPAKEILRSEFMQALRIFIRDEPISVAMRPRKEDLAKPDEPEVQKAKEKGWFK